MMASHLILLILLQTSAQQIELPLSTFGQMSPYMTCLLRPLEGLGDVPESRPAREALVAGIVERCRPVRNRSSEEADRILSAEPGHADAHVRHAAIERMLRYFEQYLRFAIVERERFVEAVEAEER